MAVRVASRVSCDAASPCGQVASAAAGSAVAVLGDRSGYLRLRRCQRHCGLVPVDSL